MHRPRLLPLCVAVVALGLPTVTRADGPVSDDPGDRVERTAHRLRTLRRDLRRAVRADLQRAAGTLEEAADEFEAGFGEAAEEIGDRVGQGAEDLGDDLEDLGDDLEGFGEEAAARTGRLAAVPARALAALREDPDAARRELARGLDPTDPGSPLRGLTRNRALDPYMLVDWLTPHRRDDFIVVRPGAGADGRPTPVRYARSTVVYVNGALTSKDHAVNTGRRIADRLGAVVLVCHNETNGVLGDGLEALLNMADARVGVGENLRGAVAGPGPVTLIGHSQGGAQIHAVLTARKRKGLSNAHVAAVLLGAPNGAETGLTEGPSAVGKWTFVTNGRDVVPTIVGRNRLAAGPRAVLKGLTPDGVKADLAGFDDHAVEYYIPLLTDAMLW